VQSPPSLWDTLVKLALTAIVGQGVVKGVVGRSRCIRHLIDLAKSLGVKVFRAGDRVEFHGHTGELRPIVYFNVDCGLHTAALALAVAAKYLVPPHRLVLRATNEAYLHANLKPLLELAEALGLKAWPGGSLSRLLIVEPKSAGFTPRPIRLSTPYAYTIAAALLIAAAAGVTVRTIYPLDEVRGKVRLDSTISLLADLGVKVEQRSEYTISVEPLGLNTVSLSVEGGYNEVAALLSILLPCRNVELTVTGLPEKQWGTEQDFMYLLESIGYKVEGECERGSCSIRAVYSGEPIRGVTYSAERNPDLIHALLAYSIVAGEAYISGLKAVDDEEPIIPYIERGYATLGFRAYIEDNGNRLVVLPPELEKDTMENVKRRLECKAAPLLCTAFTSWVIASCKGEVENIEILEDTIPSILDNLVGLTGIIDVISS
jgi:5-enolpyruvylshikimate-3-phosphate synthase